MGRYRVLGEQVSRDIRTRLKSRNHAHKRLLLVQNKLNALRKKLGLRADRDRDHDGDDRGNFPFGSCCSCSYQNSRRTSGFGNLGSCLTCGN